jgi:hypothetical protein
MKTILNTALILLLGVWQAVAAPKEEKREPEKNAPAKAAPDVTKPETLVGLPHKEAKDLADKAKVPNRVIKRDGNDLPATMDFLENRLNFTVVNDIVTAVKKAR